MKWIQHWQSHFQRANARGPGVQKRGGLQEIKPEPEPGILARDSCHIPDSESASELRGGTMAMLAGPVGYMVSSFKHALRHTLLASTQVTVRFWMKLLKTGCAE